MHPDKIDYARLGEDYIADNGGIEDALRKIEMPVYVIFRHGFYKRFLSRSAAIDNLARIMATHVFERMDIPVRSAPTFSPLNNAWSLGELTTRYVLCRERAKRRILRLLAKRREIEKWNNDYKKWVDKCEIMRKELYNRKPYK